MKRIFTAAAVVLALCAAAAPSASTAKPAAVRGYDPTEKSILELQADMAAGRVTAEGLVKAYSLRIERLDWSGPSLRSVIAINPDALAQARALDAERKAGKVRGPLHGIPVALKDIYETAGVLTTGHSHLRKDYVPAIDAETVRRLKAAGAVILGKLGTHEFANGAMTPDQPRSEEHTSELQSH